MQLKRYIVVTNKWDWQRKKSRPSVTMRQRKGDIAWNEFAYEVLINVPDFSQVMGIEPIQLDVPVPNTDELILDVLAMDES
jgi:hypothetical protein